MNTKRDEKAWLIENIRGNSIVVWKSHFFPPFDDPKHHPTLQPVTIIISSIEVQQWDRPLP